MSEKKRAFSIRLIACAVTFAVALFVWKFRSNQLEIELLEFEVDRQRKEINKLHLSMNVKFDLETADRYFRREMEKYKKLYENCKDEQK